MEDHVPSGDLNHCRSIPKSPAFLLLLIGRLFCLPHTLFADNLVWDTHTIKTVVMDKNSHFHIPLSSKALCVIKNQILSYVFLYIKINLLNRKITSFNEEQAVIRSDYCLSLILPLHRRWKWLKINLARFVWFFPVQQIAFHFGSRHRARVW